MSCLYCRDRLDHRVLSEVRGGCHSAENKRIVLPISLTPPWRSDLGADAIVVEKGKKEKKDEINTVPER